MAKVTVRLYGVLRVDTHLAKEQVEAVKLDDVFALLNQKVDEIYAENVKEKPTLEHPCLKLVPFLTCSPLCSQRHSSLNSCFPFLTV